MFSLSTRVHYLYVTPFCALSFEMELRVVYPFLSLPYWDSTLDSGLPNPADSVMWMPELMGFVDEPVYTNHINYLTETWKTANVSYLSYFRTIDAVFRARR